MQVLAKRDITGKTHSYSSFKKESSTAKLGRRWKSRDGKQHHIIAMVSTRMMVIMLLPSSGGLCFPFCGRSRCSDVITDACASMRQL